MHSGWLGLWQVPPLRPNNSFKPNLLRYTKHMAEKACHVFGSATQVGLTQALGGRKAFGGFAFQHGDFAGFGWRCSSVYFTRRYFFGQVRLARSHIACVTLAGFGNCDWCGQLFRR